MPGRGVDLVLSGGAVLSAVVRGPAGSSAAADVGAVTAAREAPPKSAAPAAAVTRVRNSRIAAAPPPAGCTRFVRMSRYERLRGSIQTEVPVNPVWPTAPSGKNG